MLYIKNIPHNYIASGKIIGTVHGTQRFLKNVRKLGKVICKMYVKCMYLSVKDYDDMLLWGTLDMCDMGRYG